MGRLIDADLLKQKVAAITLKENLVVSKANAICELVDVQPTAYDLNKVVEQLSNIKFRKFDKELLMLLAIDIVKKGGVE